METYQFKLKDLRDGLDAVCDQLEVMGFPYPLCKDFKVLIKPCRGRPEFSIEFPTVKV